VIGVPTEHAEQVEVVKWLRRRGAVVFAVPNGGKRSKITAAILKEEGVEAGVPDLVCLTRPPKAAHFVGVVIEMKRRKGGSFPPAQRAWKAHFERAGWLHILGKGCEDAIQKLQAVGF
jgi:hypothetical protein